MGKAGDGDPQAAEKHTRNQHDGEVADRADTPVKQRHQQQRKGRRQSTYFPGRKLGRQVMKVLSEADATARHRERGGKEICQTIRKESQRPMRCGPYASRR